jgi:uncharacterized protein (DUF2126 family)/transglutaminase-like putative cysteine protease
MAIRVALNHKTSYRYPKDVWLSPQVVRLRPAPHCRTPIVSYSLTVTPKEYFINWQQDPYSNRLARLVFPKKTREFAVEVDLVAEMTVINPFDFFIEKSADEFPFVYDATLSRELAPYLETAPAGPKLAALIAKSRKKNVKTIDYLVGLNQSLSGEVKYLIRLEPGLQSPEETLTLGSGSCRDSAWLLVQLLRHLGLAARFASGYLIQLAPDVKSLDGPSGVAKDFTDLHAWAEVYLPGAGWIGLDATSGLLAGEGHIPLACTADPVTAAPITGAFSISDVSVISLDPQEELSANGQAVFGFEMSVTRIHEDPRVTKPYTEEQWAEIEAVGHQIDADLKRGDVRLTNGGEPTFVSIDDMDGPEWNSLALGPMKYRRADELLRRLRDRFAPGGFLHHGQGKWYPGESLPRWAFGLYWRRDGEPVWTDPKLVADETKPVRFAEDAPRGFITRLAERLGVEPRYVVPGFEDVWYYLWKERRLPVNVDPFDNKLENPEDRARLAKVFEQGMEKVVGYALPLRRDHFADGTGAWVSGDWFYRPERMYLVPGDSPMGYRLPLDSLPWVVKSDYPFVHEMDPFAPREGLPPRSDLLEQRFVPGGQSPRNPQGFVEQWPGQAGTPGTGKLGPRKPLAPGETREPHEPHEGIVPEHGESAPWIVRTALCVEVRNGTMRVFMPPQRYLEDYLELVATLEETARDLKIPILVEGYPPPYDPRLRALKVTPDPGVIEVNTDPVDSWDELVKNTNAIYEEARLSRLGAEKFMTDGRHTGTGGGNHIVVGGATPADSPFLRRPDLLKSLLGYWNNHPALSYLFSGLFVGPTSQAPRVDEARNDQIAELELAFTQVPAHEATAPWLVDRIFRNLLIDATGNTHRAEFCIDKLYNPDSTTGRLGLVELRAFEMLPHARMNLVQHLLLRSLIARFWREPYEQKLVRWGTQIHDRFMLPHFVRQDLEDIIIEQNEAGIPMALEWFEPHLEFRFPQFGHIEHRGVTMELRQAIEPWHVLGEEGGAAGTVRYVDSSLERLQVLVNGMIDPRHIVTCNGVRVPLHPTGTNGQAVAGVRFRAWKPAQGLQPTIGVHSPLVFDIVDTWAGRSIGGCTYHVMHPGGRSYQNFPVNSYEAEGRRIARFYKFGHTPGPMRIVEPAHNREFPLTLDLRRE